ncbi:MAG: hypothetical protein WKF68_02510 [Daejeonella sp.]
MEYATKPQITKLHILFAALYLIDGKKALIREFTKGRTDSTKALYFNEAKFLIAELCKYDPSERLKAIINRLAYQAGITYGNTAVDQQLNKAKLNLFLRAKGSVKKDLNHQNYTELIKTHRQLEAICRNVSASKDNKAATTAVQDLLNEMNLTSHKH